MRQFDEKDVEKMIEHGWLVPAEFFEPGSVYVVLVDDNGPDQFFRFLPDKYRSSAQYRPH